MKVGFIGYGSMGSMLVNSFIEYGALKPEDIIISTRTRFYRIVKYIKKQTRLTILKAKKMSVTNGQQKSQEGENMI